LYASSNQLTSLPETWDLQQLNQLYLSNNQLTTLPENLLDTIPGNIDVSSNLLTRIPSSWAAEVLIANDNPLTSLPEAFLTGSTRSFILSMKNCLLVELPARFWTSQRAIGELILNNNKLTTLNYQSGLCELTTLQVTGNPLQSIPVELFRDCQKLTMLSLEATQATLQPEHIKAMKAIQVLELTDTRLGDGAESEIASLTSLQVLNLGGPDLCRDSGVLELQLTGNFASLSVVRSSCRSIRVVTASVASLVVTDNPELLTIVLVGPAVVQRVNLSSNPKLQSISAPVIRQLDISYSGLPYLKALCTTKGTQALIVQGMLDSDGFRQHGRELLSACWRRARSIDISNNIWANNITLLRGIFGRSPYASEALKDGSTEVEWIDTGNATLTTITMRHVPIVCSTMLNYISSADRGVFSVVETECSCTPGYKGQGDVCVRKRPFLATTSGVVTVVFTTLAAAALLAGLSYTTYRHRHNLLQRLDVAYVDLELQQELLLHSEQEVLALKRAWEIDETELVLGDRIDMDSPGSFGTVYAAKWDHVDVSCHATIHLTCASILVAAGGCQGS
jgi:hypothetical protein